MTTSAPQRPRPITMSLLALIYLISAICWLFAAPIVLFGAVVPFSLVPIVRTVFVLLQLFLTVGIYRLREPARRIAIGYETLQIFLALLPSLQTILAEISSGYVVMAGNDLSAMLVALLPHAIFIWLLVTRQWAFMQPAAASAEPQTPPPT